MLETVAAALLVLVASAPSGATARAAPPSALDAPFSRSTVTLSISGTGDRVRDTGDRMLTGSVSLRGTTTVVSDVRVDADGARAWAIVAGADARTFTTDVAGIDGASRFYRFGLSAGAFYRAPSRNTYALHLGAFVAEQGSLLGSPTLHPFLAGIGTHRTSDEVTLVYGLGYTHAYGRGFPMPLLGLEWRWTPGWRLDVLLPITARVVWAVHPDLSLSAGLGGSGDLFRYRALDQSTHDLRIARVRLGVAARYALAASWHVGAGLGAEASWIDTGLASTRGFGGYVQANVGYGAASIATGVSALQ